MRIVALIDAPSARPVLARWFKAEWPSWCGPGGRADSGADLAAAAASRDLLPFGLVALDDGGAVLGTATLKADGAGSETGAGPWLGALLVGEAHRGKGVATALVAAVEGEARRLGFADIYAAVIPARTLLRHCGWEFAGTAGSFGQPLAIYHRRLGAAPLPEGEDTEPCPHGTWAGPSSG